MKYNLGMRLFCNLSSRAQRETVTDASQGIQLAFIQALARYWATDYDWRKVEAKLKALPQFITNIDGLDIHFIHVRSKHENAFPQSYPFQRPPQRRALCRLGTAATVFRGGSRGLETTAESMP
jgi:hypothetical protein